MTSSLRPRGISIICFLLGWLSFAGFANTAMILLNDDVPIPKWFGFFALAYGITAFVATYKLWQMDKSGVVWFRSWAAVVILMSIAMIPIFSDLALGGIGGMFGFVLFTAAFLWLIDRYVSKKLLMGD
jgi:hypothetical protein